MKSRYYIRVVRDDRPFNAPRYLVRKRRRFLWDITIYQAYSKEEAEDIVKHYKEGTYE